MDNCLVLKYFLFLLGDFVILHYDYGTQVNPWNVLTTFQFLYKITKEQVWDYRIKIDVSNKKAFNIY